MLDKENTLVEEIVEETEGYSDDSLFNITSFGTDLSFREIINIYEEGELEKPELQRKYVWTKNEASRFIDSILLGLPVPSIFLAKTKNEKRLIVDGYQRLMTVYDYINGVFTGDGKIFKLSNTDNINEKWRGKAFKELTNEEQRKIRGSQIHAIVFEQKKPQDDTGMFQIFERINTSGKVLKPQEIRNCVYQGEFNTLLFSLNKLPIWRKLLGVKQEDSRMYDIELILRFFAIGHIKDEKEINHSQINLSKYLNSFMGKYRNLSKNKSLEFKTEFEKVLTFISVRIGENAFKNRKINNGAASFTKKINPVVFDAVCTATIYALQNNFDMSLDSEKDLADKYIELVSDENFISATTIRTTNIDSIKTRVNKATSILYGMDYGW